LQPAGFSAPVAIWQSQVNGAMSEKIQASTSPYALPDSSVTTFVYSTVNPSAIHTGDTQALQKASPKRYDMLGRSAHWHP
jgi:hypothetical protein